MQSYLTRNKFTLLEEVTWTPVTEDVAHYNLSKATKVTKQNQNLPSKINSIGAQSGVQNLPPPCWLKDDIIDFYCHICSVEQTATILSSVLSIRAC